MIQIYNSGFRPFVDMSFLKSDFTSILRFRNRKGWVVIEIDTGFRPLIIQQSHCYIEEGYIEEDMIPILFLGAW